VNLGSITCSNHQAECQGRISPALCAWWQGDPEIDTTQVDSTQKVEDYDAETQGAIRKIMVSRPDQKSLVYRVISDQNDCLQFDQKQKAMGLPTSDEILTQEVLGQGEGPAWEPLPAAGLTSLMTVQRVLCPVYYPLVEDNKEGPSVLWW
jgi:hypothetical protein